MALKYRLPFADDWPVSLTLFSGLRYELQKVEGAVSFTFESLVDASNPWSSTRGPSGPVRLQRGRVPVGLTAAYPFDGVGLTPYLVGTVFPFARVDFGTAGDTRPSPSPPRTLRRR